MLQVIKKTMTPEQFCYWLQGYSEICGEIPNKDEWQVIEDHLKTVFHKITPPKDALQMWMPRNSDQFGVEGPTTFIC